MPMHSLPSSLVWSEYSYAPSSTRATSLSMTIFPPGSFFMTMFSNSSGVSKRPWVFIMSSYAASGLERGSWFSFPAATCLFCSLSAACHLRRRHVHVREPVGIEPYAHGVLALAVDFDLAHAVDSRDAVFHLGQRVVCKV